MGEDLLSKFHWIRAGLLSGKSCMGKQFNSQGGALRKKKRFSAWQFWLHIWDIWGHSTVILFQLLCCWIFFSGPLSALTEHNIHQSFHYNYVPAKITKLLSISYSWTREYYGYIPLPQLMHTECDVNNHQWKKVQGWVIMQMWSIYSAWGSIAEWL